MDSTLETPVNAQPDSQASSPAPSEEKPKTDAQAEREQVKALLAEARNTREMLVSFEAAINGGTFHGGKMLDIAKGMAFLNAILGQNSAHIDNLQKRLEAK